MPAHKIRTAALAAALACTLPLAGCSRSGNDGSAPQPVPTPQTSSDAATDDKREAIAVYENYVRRTYALRSTAKDSRREYLSEIATKDALDNAVKNAEDADKQDIRNLGYVTPHPQVVAWTADSLTIFDCTETKHSSTKSGEYGTVIAKPPTQLFEAIVVREEGKWKVKENTPKALSCQTHSDPFTLLRAQAPATAPEEQAAFDVYRKFWEATYKLTDHLEDQRKKIMTEYSEGTASKFALDKARYFDKGNAKSVGETRSNPQVVATRKDLVYIYDCQDDSRVGLTKDGGSTYGYGKNGVAYQATVARNENNKWVVTKIANVNGMGCS